MADFLGRLVRRALGTAPTVQPMIAPMFAPRQAMVVDGSPSFASESGPESDAGEQYATFTPATRPTSSQPLQLPPTLVTQGNLPAGGSRPALNNMTEAPRQRILSDSTGQVEFPASPQPATFTTFSQEGPTRSIHVTPSRVQPLQEQGAGTQSTHLLGAQPPQQVKRRPVRISSEEMYGAGMQSVQVWGTQADVPVSRAGRDMSSSVQPGVPELWLPVVLPTQKLAPRRGVTRPQADAHLEPTEHIVVSQREEAPGPPPATSTISVTIGRIEVRATPPPPARAQSQRPASPVMNLDQYLHQRAKGGDR